MERAGGGCVTEGRLPRPASETVVEKISTNDSPDSLERVHREDGAVKDVSSSSRPCSSILCPREAAPLVSPWSIPGCAPPPYPSQTFPCLVSRPTRTPGTNHDKSVRSGRITRGTELPRVAVSRSSLIVWHKQLDAAG